MIYILTILLFIPLNLLFFLLITENFPNISEVSVAVSIISFWVLPFLSAILYIYYLKLKHFVGDKIQKSKIFRYICFLTIFISLIVLEVYLLFIFLTEFTTWNTSEKFSTIALFLIFVIPVFRILDQCFSFLKSFKRFIDTNETFHLIVFVLTLLFTFFLVLAKFISP